MLTALRTASPAWRMGILRRYFNPAGPPNNLMPYVAQCYADALLTKQLLGWHAAHSLADMCADTWRWQQGNPNGYATDAPQARDDSTSLAEPLLCAPSPN